MGSGLPGLLEKIAIKVGHRLNEQATVKVEVSSLTACLSDQKTPMAGGSKERPVRRTLAGFVIRTDWIIRTNCQAIKCASKDRRQAPADSR